MAHLAPAGPVYQAGTLSGNPVATAAGLATLRRCDEAVYATVDAVSAQRRATWSARRCARRACRTGVQRAGNMFSVFFTDERRRRLRRRQDAGDCRYPAFFHAMLDRGVYLPPSAFEAWFVSAAHDDAAVERIAAALPPPPAAARRGAAEGPDVPADAVARRRRTARPMSAEDSTVVHLMRHGEVHNPDGVLYGRLPGYHLSELGQKMAERVAEHLADHDVTPVVASPLERAQETAAPIAAAPRPGGRHRRAADRGGERLRGQDVRRRRRRRCASPANWRYLTNPFRPVLGRAVPGAGRAHAGGARRGAGRGPRPRGGAVSHQLPIWIVRGFAERRRLWHDPRRRQCTLASLTSFTYRRRRARLRGLLRAGARPRPTAPAGRCQAAQGAVPGRRGVGGGPGAPRLPARRGQRTLGDRRACRGVRSPAGVPVAPPLPGRGAAARRGPDHSNGAGRA